MRSATPLEAVLRRDRAIIIAGLVAVSALAWAYLGYLSWDMRQSMSAGTMAMAASPVRPWGAVDFALMYLMWAVMMVAMMAASTTPMLLTFAAMNRRLRERSQPYVPTGIFLLGYLAVWFGFAALATLVQWGLHQAALVSSMMGKATPLVGGAILVVAGAFQWTPFKNACLKHCRTPLGFVMTEWRDGHLGALTMGLRHGSVCVGCCWFLMGLMFVAGVMNILWMATVAAYILVEKVIPAGQWVGRIVGLGLVAWGVWTLVGTFG